MSIGNSTDLRGTSILGIFLFVLLCTGCTTSEHLEGFGTYTMKSIWPQAIPVAPKAKTFAQACAALHGPNRQWLRNGSQVVCGGNPKEPPLILETAAKPVQIINHQPWRIALESQLIPWPSNPISFFNMTVVPEKKNSYRLTGGIRLLDKTPWVSLRLYVVAPKADGDMTVQGRCVQGKINSLQPLASQGLRALSCRIEQSAVQKNQEGKHFLWLLYRYQRKGEPEEMGRLRLMPTMIPVEAPQNSLAILAPGRAYQQLNDGRPSQPVTIDSHRLVRIDQRQSNYWKISLEDKSELFVRRDPQPGKASLAYRFSSAEPLPQHLPKDLTFMYRNDLPRPVYIKNCQKQPVPSAIGTATVVVHKATPLAADARDGSNLFVAVVLETSNGTPLLDWLEIKVSNAAITCVNPTTSAH